MQPTCTGRGWGGCDDDCGGVLYLYNYKLNIIQNLKRINVNNEQKTAAAKLINRWSFIRANSNQGIKQATQHKEWGKKSYAVQTSDHLK